MTIDSLNLELKNLKKELRQYKPDQVDHFYILCQISDIKDQIKQLKSGK